MHSTNRVFLAKVVKTHSRRYHFEQEKGLETMFELNDQELEQVAGGHSHHNHQYGSHSNAQGTGSATLGAAESHSFSTSQVGPHGAKSYAWNDTLAIGVNPTASSSSDTSAGAKY